MTPPQCPQHGRIETVKKIKIVLECTALFLRLNKYEIQLIHKEKLLPLEKTISIFKLMHGSSHAEAVSPCE
ncbi:hypothetical protein T459_27383 [Capsicum annuum]|uniref:Uncharacterized protein n=1 Tax=Capsicum annuum TaxID=4072 RepID=A0A2G2YDS9_CAPAN|nr:hypothetical protein FXO37_12908 [Capsicum annuum]PHT67896.1 hypothetical protein T459_27383 [Capsicum annuum]